MAGNLAAKVVTWYRARLGDLYAAEHSPAVG
jgi:hypothetical protein